MRLGRGALKDIGPFTFRVSQRLLCLAQRAWREHGCERTLVCVDAHMGEVYWARAAVRDGVVGIVGDERLAAPNDVEPPSGTYCAVGNGYAAHVDALAQIASGAELVFAELTPSAVDLLPQAKRALVDGHVLAAAAALPVYLREHTAWRRSS